MIDVALNFLCGQLNAYMLNKLFPPPTVPDVDAVVVLTNIAQLNELTPSSAGDISDPQNACISLVNIEEDRISKSQENIVRKDSILTYKNPRIFLNLYVLFAVNLNNYTEALKRLSYIIQFFQYKNVFTPANSPVKNLANSLTPDGRTPSIEKLIVDMYSLNFEQSNQLWATLGGRYIPSVLYKVRLVAIEDDAVDAGGGLITSITINTPV